MDMGQGQKKVVPPKVPKTCPHFGGRCFINRQLIFQLKLVFAHWVFVKDLLCRKYQSAWRQIGYTYFLFAFQDTFCMVTPSASSSLALDPQGKQKTSLHGDPVLIWTFRKVFWSLSVVLYSTQALMSCSESLSRPLTVAYQTFDWYIRKRFYSSVQCQT